MSLQSHNYKSVIFASPKESFKMNEKMSTIRLLEDEEQKSNLLLVESA